MGRTERTTSFLSPGGQTTGRQAPEENLTVEDAPLEDAPGGGNKGGPSK